MYCKTVVTLFAVAFGDCEFNVPNKKLYGMHHKLTR